MATFSLKLGIKKFGLKGYKATYGEIQQLHKITWFIPIKVADFNQRERKIALELLIFIVGKKGPKS